MYNFLSLNFSNMIDVHFIHVLCGEKSLFDDENVKIFKPVYTVIQNVEYLTKLFRFICTMFLFSF